MDTTKIRSILGGWLYAYETPEPPPLQSIPRADSPDEQARVSKVHHLKYQRTMSMHQSKGLKEAAKQARANKEQKALSTMAEERRGTLQGAETPGLSQSDEGREVMEVGSVVAVPEISVHTEEGLSVPSSPDPVPVAVSNDAGSSASVVEPPVDATPGTTSVVEPHVDAMPGTTSVVEPPVDATPGTTSVVEPHVDATPGTTSVVEPPVDATSGTTSVVEPPVDATTPSLELPPITTTMPPQPPPVNIVNSGFVFAVHRRTVGCCEDDLDVMTSVGVRMTQC